MKLPFQGTKSFFDSAERDAVIAAGGAAFGTALISFTPQLPLGNYSYLSYTIYGAGLILVGMHVKMDGLGYFLIGMGVVYLVDGIIRIAIPRLRYVPAASYLSLKTPTSSMQSVNL